MNIQTRPSTTTTGTTTGTSFARLSTDPGTWIEQNRALVLRLSVLLAALVLVGIAASIFISNRANKAQDAFNNAMDVYDAPLQPVQNVKSYPSAAARARDANPLFRDVAAKYGFFKAGANARYFAGLTDEDLGNMAAAEADLKKAAGSSDAGLAALAKMALASLYTNTGRAGDAAAIYHALIDHPTATVSANAARLALAGSEETTHPQAARELYAKIKDTDKTTAAGQIAAQKLAGK